MTSCDKLIVRGSRPTDWAAGFGATDVQKVTRVEAGVNLSACNVHESSRPLGVQRKRTIWHIPQRQWRKSYPKMKIQSCWVLQMWRHMGVLSAPHPQDGPSLNCLQIFSWMLCSDYLPLSAPDSSSWCMRVVHLSSRRELCLGGLRLIWRFQYVWHLIKSSPKHVDLFHIFAADYLAEIFPCDWQIEGSGAETIKWETL